MHDSNPPHIKKIQIATKASRRFYGNSHLHGNVKSPSGLRETIIQKLD
jgi:hypothetical protein